MGRLMTALLCAFVAAGDGKSEAELARLAERIRPRPDEVAWLKIPWIVSLSEARKMAREENRPIFLWDSTGDPLDQS